MIADRLRRLAGSRRAATWASALLLVGAGAAAASVFPFMAGLPDVTAVYRTPQPVVGMKPGVKLPVYDVQPDGRAVRSGQAYVDDQGRLQLSRYDGYGESAAVPEAVLMPASVRSLWVLATEAEREELRNTARGFIRALGAAIDGAVNSPVFDTEYKPVIEDTIRAAATAAWSSPPVQAAFSDLLQVADPMLRQVAANDLRPALVERLQPALWQAVRTNAVNIIDVFSDFRLDLKPLENAVSGAIGDRRVRDGMANMLAILAGTHQMRILAERLGTEFLNNLRNDPRLADTLGRMMQDGRLSAYLEPLGDPALTLARAVPRTLARLDDHADLNSLAADIFKMQARGISTHVVIHMTTKDRDRVAAIDPLAPVTLVREAR